MSNRSEERGFELEVSERIRLLDYDAVRYGMSAEVTGEASLLTEPYESLLWYVPGDPALLSVAGTARFVEAARQLGPFFETFAQEQATGSGPTAAELSERLERAIERNQL